MRGDERGWEGMGGDGRGWEGWEGMGWEGMGGDGRGVSGFIGGAEAWPHRVQDTGMVVDTTF